MNIAAYIDVANLYYRIKDKYKDRKLNYKKYYKYLKDLGHVKVCNAYYNISKSSEDDDKFKGNLTKLGYTFVTKEYTSPHKNNFNVEITIDCLDHLITSTYINSMPQVMEIDCVVLGSADTSLIPLIKHVKNKGIKVIILASSISNKYNDLDVIKLEVPESLLL